jgi:hypothetical protein
MSATLLLPCFVQRYYHVHSAATFWLLLLRQMLCHVYVQGLGLELKPDIAAPGFRLYSSTPANNYQTLSGTSM